MYFVHQTFVYFHEHPKYSHSFIRQLLLGDNLLANYQPPPLSYKSTNRSENIILHLTERNQKEINVEDSRQTSKYLKQLFYNVLLYRWRGWVFSVFVPEWFSPPILAHGFTGVNTERVPTRPAKKNTTAIYCFRAFLTDILMKNKKWKRLF